MNARVEVVRRPSLARARTRRAVAVALASLLASAAFGEGLAPDGAGASDPSRSEPLAAPPEVEGRDPGRSPAAAVPAPIAQVVHSDPEEIVGSGLPEAPPVDGYRDDLERSWFGGGASMTSRATAARVRKLELGAQAVLGPAHALLAEQGGGELGQAMLAAKLAPDLPLAHVALARAHWAEGDRGEAARAFADALLAIPRNLEAALWLASSALWIAVIAFALGALGFVALASASALPRAAHDLGDLFSKHVPAFGRAALLGALLLVPVALGEGVLGLALALFAVGVAYGTSSHRISLAVAATLLVLALFPVAEMAGRVVSMFAADPVADAAYSVAQGIETDDDVALLADAAAGDPLAAHALAVRARRTGHLDEAYRRYRALVEQKPRDPVALTNLANLQFQRGAIDEAIALYTRATAVHDSAVLWFDLSQAYARSFRMEEFETALRRAQELDADVVAELSGQKDPSLIADLPLDEVALAARMFEHARGDAFAAWLRRPLAPAWLGADGRHAALAFAGAFLLALIVGTRFDHAGACRRCGVRICARCDGTVWNNQTCENCHRLFNHPETTEGGLRAARLAALRRREARVERLAQAVALVLPGAGGLLARRPDLAFVAVMLFAWAATAWAWREGALPDPLVVGAAGPAVFLATAVASGLAYVVLVFAALAIRRSQ
ncbi:MAG: hypothetical protein R3E88_20540 [Myxococcota bacterium]